MEVITRDVTEAAYFRALGMDIVSTRFGDKTNKTRVYFTFEFCGTDADMDKIRCEFTNRKARVEPKAFHECLKDVKDILHDTLRSRK